MVEDEILRGLAEFMDTMHSQKVPDNYAIIVNDVKFEMRVVNDSVTRLVISDIFGVTGQHDLTREQLVKLGSMLVAYGKR